MFLNRIFHKTERSDHKRNPILYTSLIPINQPTPKSPSILNHFSPLPIYLSFKPFKKNIIVKRREGRKNTTPFHFPYLPLFLHSMYIYNSTLYPPPPPSLLFGCSAKSAFNRMCHPPMPTFFSQLSGSLMFRLGNLLSIG